MGIKFLVTFRYTCTMHANEGRSRRKKNEWIFETIIICVRRFAVMIWKLVYRMLRNVRSLTMSVLNERQKSLWLRWILRFCHVIIIDDTPHTRYTQYVHVHNEDYNVTYMLRSSSFLSSTWNTISLILLYGITKNLILFIFAYFFFLSFFIYLILMNKIQDTWVQ